MEKLSEEMKGFKQQVELGDPNLYVSSPQELGDYEISIGQDDDV